MTQEIATSGKTLIAIYDMDKTVTRRATYNGFLIHMAKNRAPWRFLLAPLLPFGLAMYGLKIWSRERLKEFSQSLFLGRKVSLEEISVHLKTHAEVVVGTNIYPEFNALLREEKAAGYRHVIATASYKLYVEAIAERLKFDDVIATDLVTDGGGHVLARIAGGNCYDTAKLEKVKAWMEEQGLSRADCFIRAYSDHVSDAPLLVFADEAFATNPHPPLAKLANEKGWQIINWR
jgi:HAD superfamily hydrolase (TIGR01490 family)